MDIKELTIGNWVKLTPDTFVQVGDIRSDGIMFNQWDKCELTTSLDPIFLSYSILFNSGWAIRTPFAYFYEETGHLLTYNRDSAVLEVTFAELDNSCSSKQMALQPVKITQVAKIPNISSVHHLQNILNHLGFGKVANKIKIE